jgi:hypothetical protein
LLAFADLPDTPKNRQLGWIRPDPARCFATGIPSPLADSRSKPLQKDLTIVRH